MRLWLILLLRHLVNERSPLLRGDRGLHKDDLNYLLTFLTPKRHRKLVKGAAAYHGDWVPKNGIEAETYLLVTVLWVWINASQILSLVATGRPARKVELDDALRDPFTFLENVTETILQFIHLHRGGEVLAPLTTSPSEDAVEEEERSFGPPQQSSTGTEPVSPIPASGEQTVAPASAPSKLAGAAPTPKA